MENLNNKNHFVILKSNWLGGRKVKLSLMGRTLKAVVELSCTLISVDFKLASRHTRLQQERVKCHRKPGENGPITLILVR